MALFWVALLLCLGTNPTAVRAADSSDSELASAPQGEEAASDQPKVIDYETSVRNQVAAIRDRETQYKPVEGLSTLEMLGCVAATIAGILLWRAVAPRVGNFLCGRFNPWVSEDASLLDQLAEAESFEKFADSLRSGPSAPSASDGAGHVAEPASASALEPDPLQTFYASALEEIGNLRKLFSRIGSCRDEAEKRQILEELSSRVCHFKRTANLPETKPLWQVSATLEGLLNHLAAQPQKLAPSCLRTAVSSLDLITELCVPGVRPCLVTDPPVRLLAVDDDAISRVAVSNALKKVFSAPELAVDGPSTLEVAVGKHFDMIFLDIEMPGMNGFELCAKLRQMPECEHTPIVFVTSHSDFNSRAQLPLAGAQDLIAKPFLSFEVALKALTFVLRGRLAEDRKLAEAAQLSPPIPEPTRATPANLHADAFRLPSQALAPG